MTRSSVFALAGGFGLAVALSLPAMAHHGWAWTSNEIFELNGTVTEVNYGNPHPVLTVEADGATWQVELAPPAASTAAGFVAESAKPGDSITLFGNRSLTPNETRMKAVRVIVEGTTYDVYPDRAARI